MCGRIYYLRISLKAECVKFIWKGKAEKRRQIFYAIIKISRLSRSWSPKNSFFRFSLRNKIDFGFDRNFSFFNSTFSALPRKPNWSVIFYDCNDWQNCGLRTMIYCYLVWPGHCNNLFWQYWNSNTVSFFLNINHRFEFHLSFCQNATFYFVIVTRRKKSFQKEFNKIRPTILHFSSNPNLIGFSQINCSILKYISFCCHGNVFHFSYLPLKNYIHLKWEIILNRNLSS